MLNGDVKKQINTARDILVGKIPDPKGQIDQITNALIYKFMDDQDRLSQTLPGGKASFFIKNLEKYAWHKLFDSKLSNQDRANLYIEGIAELANAKHLPELFKDVFKDAFLPFRDANTIAMFLNEINKFDYHHSENLGNAFEYLLSIMGSQGDAGQFRTPRNIIEFIVDAVDPTKDDHILDPACGTAGFLVEAYKHITSGSKLTPNEVQGLAKHIHGVDIDPGMAKIARVNLYLHGFKTPLITEDDTLTNESLWGKKYDVILANPPFMTPKGGISPHDKFNVKSNRAEVLFTDYIAEHLKLEGRAGIVIPEGVIFQSGNTYKQLRKKLVEDGFLWAVISLPSGVFNPYAGVKTSILLLDRKRAKENKEILFYKVENDGFSLGAQRQEIKNNDLPEVLEIIRSWRDGIKIESKKALFIAKDKIAEDSEYNLSIDRYGISNDYKNAKWEIVSLNKLEKDGHISFLRGQGLSKKEIVEDGMYPCIHYGEIYTLYEPIITSVISRTNFKGKIVSEKGDVLIPATTTADALGISVARSLNQKGVILGGDINIIRTLNKEVLSDYLAYMISYPPLKIELSKYAKGANILHLSNKDLKRLRIPLPPIEIQKQIVEELNRYSLVIFGAKQIIDSWKPKIIIDPNWKKIKLGEVCNFVRGPFGGSLKKEIFVDNGYAIYEQSHAISSDFSKFRYFIDKDKFSEMKRFEVKPNDIIMSCSGTMGKTAIVPKDSKVGIINQALLKLTTKNNLEVKFLKLWMDSPDFQIQLLSQVTGVAIQNVASVKVLQNLTINIPPVSIQEKIIQEIEKEQELIESVKTLVEISTQKIKDSINKLWIK